MRNSDIHGGGSRAGDNPKSRYPCGCYLEYYCEFVQTHPPAHSGGASIPSCWMPPGCDTCTLLRTAMLGCGGVRHPSDTVKESGS